MFFAQVFEFQWDGSELVEDWAKNRLYYTIQHYRDHLQHVQLSCLHELGILRLIDGMPNIRTLQLGSQLVKAYPGCTGAVSSFELSANISNEVAADILQANRDR